LGNGRCQQRTTRAEDQAWPEDYGR